VFPVIGLIPRNFFLACIKHVPFFTYTNSTAFLSKRQAFRHLTRKQGIRVNTLGAMHTRLLHVSKTTASGNRAYS
jgi:hypothetical protein